MVLLRCQAVFRSRWRWWMDSKRDPRQYIGPVHRGNGSSLTIFWYCAIFFLFLLALAVMATNLQPDSPGMEVQRSDNYRIKEIEGCHYIEFDDGIFEYRVYSLTHKGNCPNH